MLVHVIYTYYVLVLYVMLRYMSTSPSLGLRRSPRCASRRRGASQRSTRASSGVRRWRCCAASTPLKHCELEMYKMFDIALSIYDKDIIVLTWFNIYKVVVYIYKSIVYIYDI